MIRPKQDQNTARKTPDSTAVRLYSSTPLALLPAACVSFLLGCLHSISPQKMSCGPGLQFQALPYPTHTGSITLRTMGSGLPRAVVSAPVPVFLLSYFSVLHCCEKNTQHHKVSCGRICSGGDVAASHVASIVKKQGGNQGDGLVVKNFP